VLYTPKERQVKKMKGVIYARCSSDNQREESIEGQLRECKAFAENEISKIFNNEEFGYFKITVERPQKDENGNPILKKGKPVADTSLRDTENVPLTEDIEEYFKREVLPFAPDAWIDESKTKVGYEIPFTRYFYKYEAPRSSAEIMAEIMDLQTKLEGSLEEIFDV
jgi:type I restriction enzyme M protein